MGKRAEAPPGRVRGAFDVHLHLSRWWPDLPHTAYRADLDYSLAGLLAEMDAAGIVSGLAIPVHEGESVDSSFAESVGHARASSGRLRAVTTVDPTRGRGEVERVVGRWHGVPELAAIKLFPGYLPFYPHDPALDPVYEWAALHRVPVMIHQGDTLDPNGRVKFARPIEVDEVAVRFRDVRFVLCHFGNPWFDEAAEVVYKNGNVYADTSGLLANPRVPYFREMVERARTLLLGAVHTIGSVERILYGSDWPLEALETAVGLVNGLDLPQTDRDAILGTNARRLFAPPGEAAA